MFFLLKLAYCIVFVVNQSNATECIDLTDINPHEISPPPLSELITQLKTSLTLSMVEIEEESFEGFCLTSADKETEKLFLLASNGNRRAYQQLKEKAQHTDPIACGFMLRYLLTVGPTYHCYDDLDANPQEYLRKCEQSLRDLSQQEHPYALEILGLVYEVGCGAIIPDIETAKVYTLKAALKRYSRAQNLMGYVLNKQKDPEALLWFIRAARNGSLTAIRNLGFEVERIKLKELAVEFYKTAAIMGDSDSLLVIANYYKTLGDHHTAFLYLQKAVEFNSIEAYFQIGSYLLQSLLEEIGVEKPEPQSKISDYFSVAAKYRYKHAFYNLAQYYEVIKDEHEKINSLRRGDAIGDTSCTLALAKNLLETDLAESRALFEKCLSLKVKNAEAWLAQCILQECDILIDEEELLFAKLTQALDSLKLYAHEKKSVFYEVNREKTLIVIWKLLKRFLNLLDENKVVQASQLEPYISEFLLLPILDDLTEAQPLLGNFAYDLTLFYLHKQNHIQASKNMLLAVRFGHESALDLIGMVRSQIVDASTEHSNLDEPIRERRTIEEELLLMMPEPSLSPATISSLAFGYYFGRYGFSKDHVKALYWFRKGTEVGIDSFFHCLAYVQWNEGKTLQEKKEAAEIYRQAIAVQKENLNNRGVSKLHLARMLVDLSSQETGNRTNVQEAYMLINEALSDGGIGSKKRKSFTWYGVSKDMQVSFEEAEASFLDIVDSSDPSISIGKRGKAAFDLACLNLWGGFQKAKSLKQTLTHFSQALHYGEMESHLFLTVITDYLTMKTISGWVVGEPDSASVLYSARRTDLNLTTHEIVDVQRRTKLGDSAALNMIGTFYQTGSNGFSRIPVLAKLYFMKAAQAENMTAMFNLANGFFNGWFGAADENEAHKWYKEAAKRGHMPSKYMCLSIEQQRARILNVTASQPNLIKKLEELYRNKDFFPAALDLSLCYSYGLKGISPSSEHAVLWLERAAQTNQIAKLIFKSYYPTLVTLTEEELTKLWSSRTNVEGRSTIAIIGGGVGGTLSAVLLAKLRDYAGEPVFTINLIERENNLLEGASKSISRLHLGAEYPKDQLTALQCLYCAILFRQMFQTDKILTERKTLSFLLARACESEEAPHKRLQREELHQHYERIKSNYGEYYEKLKEIYGEAINDLLFGPPSTFFDVMQEDELEKLRLFSHFSTGINTRERGFQPVALGVILEKLVREQSNIKVYKNSNIIDVEHHRERGFHLRTSDSRNIYGKYLINASWDNIPRINSLVVGQPSIGAASRKDVTVYLRSLAMIDISECTALPTDRSFFGLIDSYGGMLSCFTDKVATLFIPKEGMSYQGEYHLNQDEFLISTLPTEASHRYEELKNEAKMQEIVRNMIEDAISKYPQLRGAKPITLITKTTLSSDDEIFKRTHVGATWIDEGNECLQVYASKATFAPLLAAQTLARFVMDKPEGKRVKLDESTHRFLQNISGEHVLEDPVLPRDLVLVPSIDLEESLQIDNDLYSYAFRRNLPYALFDPNDDTHGIGDVAGRFSKLALSNELDLECSVITVELAKYLIELFELQKSFVTIKLGTFIEGDDQEEEDMLGAVLTSLINLPHLKKLTLKNCNLTVLSHSKLLNVLIQKLENLTLSDDVVLDERSSKHIFKKETATNINYLSVSGSTISHIVLSHIVDFILVHHSLVDVELANNSFNFKHKEEAISSIERLIKYSQTLKHLYLNGHNLFGGESSSARSSQTPWTESNIINRVLRTIAANKSLDYVDLSNRDSTDLQNALDYYFAFRQKEHLMISPHDIEEFERQLQVSIEDGRVFTFSPEKTHDEELVPAQEVEIEYVGTLRNQPMFFEVKRIFGDDIGGGYSAMDVNRRFVVKMLKQVLGGDDELKKSIIVPILINEIEDNFERLPRSMMTKEHYRSSVREIRILDEEKQHLVVQLNDLLGQPEGQRVCDVELVRECQSRIEELTQQQAATYHQLLNLVTSEKDRIKSLKQSYARSPGVIAEYLTNYIAISPQEYYVLEKQDNRLAYHKDEESEQRLTILDAISYLQQKNLAVWENSGELLGNLILTHFYSPFPQQEILHLLYANDHFDRLKQTKKTAELSRELLSQPKARIGLERDDPKDNHEASLLQQTT